VSAEREFRTHSADETIATGHLISKLLRPNQMIVLRGDLGAGKTTLVKGIAEAFDAAHRKMSPAPRSL